MSAVALAGSGLLLGATPAGASSVITSCTTAAVQAALQQGGNWTFSCSGTIFVPSPSSGVWNPFAVKSGKNVSLDATGQNVTLDGSGEASVVTIASGATVSLTNLTIFNGHAVGANALNAQRGKAGTDGTNGTPGRTSGAAGAAGGTGQAGGAGKAGATGGGGLGGGIENLDGALTLNNVVIDEDQAFGGDGANGGDGGIAGNGGTGGGGDTGEIDSSGNPIGGGNGGNGGDGGAGGDGGNGGIGGIAEGGGIYSSGPLTVTNSLIENNTALEAKLGLAVEVSLRASAVWVVPGAEAVLRCSTETGIQSAKVRTGVRVALPERAARAVWVASAVRAAPPPAVGSTPRPP